MPLPIHPFDDEIKKAYWEKRRKAGTYVGVGNFGPTSGHPSITFDAFKRHYLRNWDLEQRDAGRARMNSLDGGALEKALSYRNYVKRMQSAAQRYNLPELAAFAPDSNEFGKRYEAQFDRPKPITVTYGGLSDQSAAREKHKFNKELLGIRLEDKGKDREVRKTVAQKQADLRQQTVDIAKARETRLSKMSEVDTLIKAARAARDWDTVAELGKLRSRIGTMKPEDVAFIDMSRFDKGIGAEGAVKAAEGEAATAEAERRANADLENTRRKSIESVANLRAQASREIAALRSANDKLEAAQKLDWELQKTIGEAEAGLEYARSTGDAAGAKYYESNIASIAKMRETVATDMARYQQQVGGPAQPQEPAGDDAMNEADAMDWLRDPANRNHPDRAIVMQALGLL